MAATTQPRAISQFAGMSLIELLISAVTFSSLGVLLPYMVSDLGWKWSEAGLGYTILGACTGASSLLPSYLIRKLGVRTTLMTGAFGMATGLYFMHNVDTTVLYLVTAAMMGISFQLLAWIPATFVITRLFRRRSMALGLYAMIGGLGTVLGPWMVLFVIGLPDHDWRDYWLYQAGAMLVLGLGAAVVVGRDRRFAQPAEQELSEPLEADAPNVTRKPRFYRTKVDWKPAEVFRRPQYYVIVAAYFANVIALTTITSLSVSHLVDQGVSTTLAAAMLSLEGAVALIFRALSGWLGDRIEPKHLMTASLTSTAIGCAFLALFTTQPWLLFYALATGIGFGTTQLCCAILLLNYFGQRYNLELFSTMCMIGAVSALGPVTGGIIRDATGSFFYIFIILAGIAFTVALATLLMRPPRHAAAHDAVEPESDPAPAPQTVPETHDMQEEKRHAIER